MKIPALCCLLLCTGLLAEVPPVHTLDQTLSLGKAVFGASAEKLRGAGLELTLKESSPDGRWEHWSLNRASDLGLDTAVPGGLFFIDNMLYEIRLWPENEQQAGILRQLAGRFTAGEEMQASQLFIVFFQEKEMFSAAFFTIQAKPLGQRVAAWQAQIRGNFDAYEAMRKP